MAVEDDTSLEDLSGDEFAEVSEDDTESMFDMFTGEAKELRPKQKAADTDYASSEASWEAIEEHEHTKYDVELRQAGQDFVTVIGQPRPTDINEAEEPKDLRTSNAKATQLYQWTPLPDQNTIRLLDLLPAERAGEPLRAQMKLSGRVNYRAVSYAHETPTEGEQQIKSTIHCDGQLLQVPASLYSHLTTIRTHLDCGEWTECKLRPCIWVDAVCLDPNDAAEQAQAANKTAEVFRNAQGAIICLENAVSPGKDTALQKTAEVLLAANLLVDGQPDERESQEIGELPFSKVDTEALLRHAWFSQRWRIQEFALQKRRTVLAGKCTIPFPALFAVIQHYGLAHSAGFVSDNARMDSFRPFRWLPANLWRFRHTRTPNTSENLPSLLNVSCSCSTGQAKSWCGSRRCAATQSARLVDGTHSIEMVLTELATIWAEYDAVAVLAVAHVLRTTAEPAAGARAATDGQYTTLPSWVPDWRILERRLPVADDINVSYLDRCFCEDDYWHPGSGFDFHEELETWTTPDGPRVLLHESPGTSAFNGRRALMLRGWILERPTPGTALSDVNWSRYTSLPGIRDGVKGVKPGLCWKSDRVKHLKARGERIRVIPGDWPELDDTDVLLFMPGRQVMFVVKPVNDGNTTYYTLASMILRDVAVDKPQFAFTDRSTGAVWAYGHFERKAAELSLI